MNKNYEILKSFFVKDLEIKKLMFSMQPPYNNEIMTDDYIIKYTDATYRKMLIIFDYFQEIIDDFNIYFLKDKFNNLKKIWLDIFVNCKNDLKKLHNFYNVYVSIMKPELIDKVKYEYIGYCFGRTKESVELIQSMNEMLHVIHSYIVNNNDIYRSLEEKGSVQLKNGYPVRLYGEQNDYIMQILDKFPLNLDCGWTDIVSLGNLNKAIMMIRDRGHALTIEIDIDGNDVIINYFIPKLCNIEMINSLPGVHKVKEDSYIGTTGIFRTDINNMYTDLFKFISMVPTDLDMTFIK